MINGKAAILSVEVAGEQYEIRQSPGLLTSSNAEGTTGAALWKISPLVAEWLADPGCSLWSQGVLHADAVIVELGCGIAGLLGCAMAKHVSKYILTDQRSVLKLLQANIDANAPRSQRSKAKGRNSKTLRSPPKSDSNVYATDLNWETDDADALDDMLSPEDTIDLVVVCDCVFNDFLLEPLVSMCKKLCSRSTENKTGLLIAQQLRSDQIFSSFMEKLTCDFRVWRLTDGSLPATLQTGSGFAVHIAIMR